MHDKYQRLAPTKTIYNISTIFQNYDPVYPYCILANSDDREHTLSNATLPSSVPTIGNGWKGEKGVAGNVE